MWRYGKSVWQVATWVPVFMTLNLSVGGLSPASGGSMKPSINPNESCGKRDWLVVKRYGLHKPGGINVGDVVLLSSPDDPEKTIVKRVLAVGGQTVRPRPTSSYPKKTCTIPTRHLWIEGDDIHSTDSNYFGPVSESLVFASAKYIIYPFNRIGPISSGGRTDAVVQTSS